MLRNTLMTAAAAAALLAAPAAFAQDAPAPTQAPAQTMQPGTTPMDSTPEATAPAATPAAPAAAATATTSTQAAATTPAAQPNNVIDVLKAQGNFTTLLTALDQAQLTDTLASRSAVTVFAPTDAAFAALPEADRTRLMDPANAQELRNLLLYHVIVADVTTDQIKGARGPVDTAGGAKIQLDGTGEMIKADGATVVAAEVDAGNGGIYAIDKVLNPTQSMAAMGDEDTDAAAPAEGAAATEADASAAATTPAAPAAPTTAAPATAAPAAPADATTPVTPTEATTPANPVAPTTTTRPATMGETAPTGEPAAAKATTQAPTVPNPTDGQQDEGEEGEAPATPN